MGHSSLEGEGYVMGHIPLPLTASLMSKLALRQCQLDASAEGELKKVKLATEKGGKFTQKERLLESPIARGVRP